MTEIFNGDYFEVINIKNLLERNNIIAFIVNETTSILEPWTITSGGFKPVTLKVNNIDCMAAKRIIEIYVDNGFNLNE